VAKSIGVTLNTADAPPDRIHISLLAGLLSHIGLADIDKKDRKDRQRRGQEYLGARGAKFAVFPGSSLFKKPPRWVMSAELVETSRLWARVNAKIEPEWIEPLAQHLVKRSYSEPHWSKKQAAVMAREKVTLYGVPIVADRRVNYGRIDPALSRELFIRHALVEGDWETHHRFFHDNRALLDEVEELEHRARRRDILVDDETLFDFYDERIPEDVVSGRHFDAWWKKARRSDPDLLSFEKSMLINESAGDVSEADYPDVWKQGPLRLRLTYQFEPGADADGVTVHIPVQVLNQVRPDGFDWQVPGLRAELVTELIRSLPKQLRVNFVPAPDYARRVLERAAGDRAGRVLLRHRHERAGLRLGPGERPHHRRARRRRLGPEPHQGVVDRRAPRPRLPRPGPHRALRPVSAPRRPQPVHRRSARPRRDREPDRDDGPRAPLQRGRAHRRVRARRPAARPGGGRLAAGHLRTRLRTQRPRTLPVHPAAAGPGRRGDPARRGAPPPRPGPPPGPRRRAAAHVPGRGPHPSGGPARRRRRRAGQSARNHPGGRHRRVRRPPRHDRPAADHRPTAPRRIHPARRHQRDPARRHRAGAGAAMTGATTIDPALQDMMTSVFADHDPETPAESLWRTLESLGLARVPTPEDRRGSSAGWAEAAALLRTAAAHGVPVPLAENDLLAGWLLAEAGLPSDAGRRTACVLDDTGTAHAVPWAADADRVTVLWSTGDGWRVA